MVQVDVFWSYGLSSGLAWVARDKLKRVAPSMTNPYFCTTLIWSTLIFVPSGIYLLWQFPGWETMFVAQSHESIPAWLALVFAFTNVSQGMLGFYVTHRLIHAGQPTLAVLQPVWSHLAMLLILVLGWDGHGYRRFLYAGTGQQWAQGVAIPLAAFWQSSIFHTLIAMAFVFVPTYTYLMVRFRGRERL